MPSPVRRRPLPARLAGEQGFTLIELLVAIIIVAILAAILVPDLLGAKGSSQDTRAKATLDTAKTAAMQYYEQHNESFTGFTAEALGKLVPTLEESKPPGGGENAEGEGHDPLAVFVETGGSGGEVFVALCSIPNKGTAVFCILSTPKGYESDKYQPGTTYYSESTTLSQELIEVVRAKGTSSYGREIGGWNREGW